jgi:microcompartment protein CcmK/EutM
MSLYEGFVAGLRADGKAEVVIRPGKPGIPGAPELTEKVCHCATNGSTVRIEALNWVGAGVGDWVLLSRRAGVLMKNAVVLLGIPVIGMLSGVVVGAIFSDGFAFRVTATVVSAAVGLLLGLVIGVATYRRMSADDQPVIRRIIRTRTDMAFVPHGDPSWTR